MNMRRNKFNVAPAKKRVYNGRTYDSLAEMEYAQLLDMKKSAGDVIEWVPQPLFELGDDYLYRPDFIVIPRTGTTHAVDVKGYETAAFKQSKKMWASYGAIPLIIIKKKGKTFQAVDVIGESRGVQTHKLLTELESVLEACDDVDFEYAERTKVNAALAYIATTRHMG